MPQTSRLKVLAIAAALAACGPAEAPSVDPAVAPTPPAAATMPDYIVPPEGETTADRLIDCAGVLAARGGIDPLADPTGPETPGTLHFWALMALLDKEGLEALAAREQVDGRRQIWAALPPVEQDLRAQACANAFPPPAQ